jgi:uncharacterized protein (TIGR02646 family)
MIQLRSKPDVPALLQSERVRRLRTKLARAATRGTIKDRVFDSSVWRDDNVRLALWKYQQRKCCYCERERDPKREPDIEHFRPKAAVFGTKGHRGYWWLAYEWQNLFFACRTCNQQHKTTKFPLRVGGKRATGPQSDLSKERAVLPDPAQEDPLSLIGFKWNYELEEVRPIPLDKDRGPKIIEVLGLDRPPLNDQRGTILTTLLAVAQKMNCAQKRGGATDVAKAAVEIRQQTRRHLEFAGFRRFYFRELGLGEYVSTD